MGNWTTEFDGGTPPTKWVGSMKILQKYYTNKKPVKYGQCWVFSGVLTTGKSLLHVYMIMLKLSFPIIVQYLKHFI